MIFGNSTVFVQTTDQSLVPETKKYSQVLFERSFCDDLKLLLERESIFDFSTGEKLKEVHSTTFSNQTPINALR